QRGGRSGRVHRDQVMPPIFKQTIQPLEINVGGHAKLECEIEDAPSVTFKWFKSGVEIRQGDKYRILSSHIVSSLEVLNPIKADSGDYTCKASNQPQWGVFLSNPALYLCILLSSHQNYAFAIFISPNTGHQMVLTHPPCPICLALRPEPPLPCRFSEKHCKISLLHWLL
uniref:Ig-like domain-containing protein n=1 Tax=Cynoglossus semilaevis TaxID=244447 RepID=A0A3P8ULA9_CYNSE